ncbi:septal ring factor EnvC (AmiA/AmiB activator) [Breznakibacter xylanolyticus]|uniref:Septal ring factor EnvC (AmiA/AmiB activator) n=1 Tax=Breznakibacter xylanolyticus TaxID=990 RepID=A0A2W7NIV4_9BACT|nr:M23 family metallopeptidase [Breznakibacter xylanolyticus]PZX19413.1 septal ring factor EnvC (AmiA/AmiB activator) [Breznakibacter xylanolyticus]
MKLFISNKVLFISLIFFFSFSLFSQDLSKYNREKERLTREIELTGKLIDENKIQQNNAAQSVVLLNTQIQSRQQLIAAYHQQIIHYNGLIQKIDSTISALNQHIILSKREYERLIQDTYLRRHSFDFAVYLFSSESFNQAYQRYRMINEINSYRKGQVKMMSESTTIISKERDKLVLLKAQVNDLLNGVSHQTRSLETEKKVLQKSLQDLKGREKRLLSDLEVKKKQQEVLEQRIVELIRELASKSSSKGKSSDFEKNKGKLIWPVINGVVVNQYGEHEHPVLKGVMVKNNGIDIQVSQNLNVHSIFSGEVSRVVAIPGYNKAVIIRHGMFLTVYANLAEIQVKQGQKVATNDLLGVVFSSNDSSSKILHFEIWNENKKVNPLDWLKR